MTTTIVRPPAPCILGLILGLLGVVAPSQARVEEPFSPEAEHVAEHVRFDASGVSVALEGPTGELKLYPVSANGTVQRAYVEARYGANYGIRVRNHTPERIGLVIAVDGRNIITGNRSKLRHDEQMYIVEPYQSVRYEGWRVSDHKVHRFYFTHQADSYAERGFGDDSAMGVVAVAAYRERPPKARSRAIGKPWFRDKAAESKASPAPNMDRERWGSSSDHELDPGRPTPGEATERRSQEDTVAGVAGSPALVAPQAKPGTGFGEKVHSPVRQVLFTPRSSAFAKRFLKYEWRETLVRRGVIPRAPVEPQNRFWPEHLGYAPYPPN